MRETTSVDAGEAPPSDGSGLSGAGGSAMSSIAVLSGTTRLSRSRKKTLFGSKPQYFAACSARSLTLPSKFIWKVANSDRAPSPPRGRRLPTLSFPGKNRTSIAIFSSRFRGRMSMNCATVCSVILDMRPRCSALRKVLCLGLRASASLRLISYRSFTALSSSCILRNDSISSLSWRPTRILSSVALLCTDSSFSSFMRSSSFPW
mmetsp:Transcript_92147/g.201976  ORF Transcript_92147/g.201976 Transcript_92147/m.201976 type:complete len:205 (+) Transcript_92147:2331-2945(+)